MRVPSAARARAMPASRPVAGSVSSPATRVGWTAAAGSVPPATIASRSAASWSARPRSQRVRCAWASQSTARVRRRARAWSGRWRRDVARPRGPDVARTAASVMASRFTRVCLTAWFVGFRLIWLSLDRCPSIRVSYPGCGRSTVGAVERVLVGGRLGERLLPGGLVQTAHRGLDRDGRAAGAALWVMPRRGGVGVVAVPDRRRPSRQREYAPELRGRRRECDLLDRLVNTVRGGESRVLVVRGEPGVGKTALLDYLVEHASGCRVASVAGVQSEMALAFAGLHQLLTPMLGRLPRLPAPQRAALRTAFGLGPGPAPDRFLVGLATLSLLADVAEEDPLVCLVDDAQWLDQASAQVLGFVARRLAAESVGLVFATRVPGEELVGLPELVVEGLQEADARALVEAALTGPLDTRVFDRLFAEAGGNPLALLELPRGLTPAELAGGFALPDAMPLSGRIEESFRRRLDALPADTRVLVLVAAADPVGDPVLVWRAAERLGIRAGAATPAAEAGLLEFGARVRFRHPLVRSAAYRSASLQERQEVHRALAQATGPAVNPDRRAWHMAQAAPGPDEDVAAELERSAGRAQARGGVAAAAAFLQRAVALTRDPARRTERALAAGQASLQAGAFDAALGLLAAAEGGGRCCVSCDRCGAARLAA